MEEKCRKSTNKKQMFKTAEREKERTKGGDGKGYKITRVKRREIFPLIYTHQVNTTAKCKCIYKEITREEYHDCRGMKQRVSIYLIR